MKYVIDSAGNAVELADSANEIRLIPVGVRVNELKVFAEELKQLLEYDGINTNSMSFFYMVQPFGTEERAVFFTKTEFNSSSTAVKIAGDLKSHPEILADRDKAEYFQSIVPVTGKGLRQYFLLSIGYVSFERNLYDCKRIMTSYTPPIPYRRFLSIMKDELITQEALDEKQLSPLYKVISEDVKLTDPDTMLSYAVHRDLRKEGSEFDKYVVNALGAYEKVNRYDLKYKKSNQSTMCLLAINAQNSNIYNEYKQIKNCIKKTLKGAYNIRYKRNKITAHLEDGNELTIYVKTTGENAQFVINGNLVQGIDNFKKYLLSDQLFSEQEWFRDKVQPYIRINQQNEIKSDRKKSTDILGWHKKSKSRKKVKTRRRTDKE